MVARQRTLAGLFSALILFTMLPAILSSASAEVRVSSRVTPPKGDMGDQYLFEVIVEGDEQGKTPLLSGGEDFELTLIGPSTSISIVNGSTSVKRTLTYALRPKRPGQLDTPSVDLAIDNQKHTVAPKRVIVLPGNERESSTSKDGVFHLEQSLNKTSVFQGEQVLNLVDFYFRKRIDSADFEDMNYDGFWYHDSGEPEQTRVSLSGQPYQRYRLRKILFPLRSGKLKIDEKKIRVRHRQRRVNRKKDPLYDRFFGFPQFDDIFSMGRSVEEVLSSEPLEIEVRPLPLIPPNFPDLSLAQPIVGLTSIELLYNQRPIEVGHSKEIQVIVRSYGSLEGLDTLPLREADSYRIYSETPRSTYELDGNLLRTTKTFQMSLVPLVPGEFRSPKIEIPYFDPKNEKYLLARSDTIRFPVEGDALITPTETESRSDEVGEQSTPEAPREFKRTESPLELLSLSALSFALAAIVALGLMSYLSLGVLAQYRRSQKERSRIKATSSLSELHREFCNILELRLNRSLERGLSHFDGVRLLVQASTLNDSNKLAVQDFLDELQQALYGSNKSSGQQERLFDNFRLKAQQILHKLR